MSKQKPNKVLIICTIENKKFSFEKLKTMNQIITIITIKYDKIKEKIENTICLINHYFKNINSI